MDGTFTFLALPGASVTEASVGRTLKLLAFPKPLLEHLGKFGLGEGTIPAGTYPEGGSNGSEPVVSATMGTTITVSDKMTQRPRLHADEDAQRQRRPGAEDPRQPRRLRARPRATCISASPCTPGPRSYYREKGWLK